MNPYMWPAACSVCGGGGRTTGNGNYAQWRGGFLSHTDPTICAYVIQQREARRQKALAALVKAS